MTTETKRYIVASTDWLTQQLHHYFMVEGFREGKARIMAAQVRLKLTPRLDHTGRHEYWMADEKPLNDAEVYALRRQIDELKQINELLERQMETMRVHHENVIDDFNLEIKAVRDIAEMDLTHSERRGALKAWANMIWNKMSSWRIYPLSADRDSEIPF